MRIMIAALVTVAMLALLALPALAQQEEAFCDWYWGYRFSSVGGWEYWCWDPRLGWYYAESEDGTSKRISLRG
jgi:hypothetical protein